MVITLNNLNIMGLLINGQVGWRTAAVIGAPAAASSLWTSVFGVWNADTLGTSLDASIRAAYNAENNANDALGTYNGTAGGALTYSAGKIGNAFDFNGTNAFVELPENTLSLSTNFSLSFWMYSRANATTSVISNFGNDGINRGFYIDQDGTQSLRFVAFNNTSAIVTSGTGTIQFNQWQHFVFNCNAGVGQWYINGSSIGSPTNISPTYISNSKPLIGTYRIGNTGGKSSYRNMKLDAFTVWNKALTANEITSLYNTGTGAEYPFSSQTLPTPNDAVSTNHGTLMNGCTFTTGKIGQAFTFDGVNDYVALPTNTLRFTEDFSVSLWVYIPISKTLNQALISCRRIPSISTGWEILVYSNIIYFGFGASNGFKTTSYSNNSNIGSWKHVVATRKNGTGGKLYIDGILQGTISAAQPISYDSVDTPSIGCMNYATGTTWFSQNGLKLDTISTWTKELTASEITELYNSGNGKQYPN